MVFVDVKHLVFEIRPEVTVYCLRDIKINETNNLADCIFRESCVSSGLDQEGV